MVIILIPIIIFIVIPFLTWYVITRINRYIFDHIDYSCRFVVEQAHEGDTIYLIEEIHNKSPLPAKRLMISIHASRWLEFASNTSTLVGLTRVVTSEFSMAGYQKIKRTWNLKCAKRGIYQIVNNTVTLRSSLNMETESAAVPVNANLTVFPEIVDMRHLMFSSNYFFGDTVVRRWIIEDPFFTAGAREYLPGDGMNRIHWTASAKKNTIMVRKNDYTAKLDLFVILNIQSMDREFDDVINKDMIEYGIKVVAGVFDLALKNGAQISFACNGGTKEDKNKTVLTEAGSSNQHVQQLLKTLSGLILKNVRYFEEYFKNLAGKISDSEIILVTSYITYDMADTVRDLVRARNNVKILILDPHAQAVSMPVGADIYYV